MNYTKTYAIELLRYNSSDGATVTPSRFLTVDATCFDNAAKMAGLMVRGAQMADPGSKFEVASILLADHTARTPDDLVAIRNPFDIPAHRVAGKEGKMPEAS